MTSKSLRDLQKIWYAKLEKEGFNDIENTSHKFRPLKEWHGLKAKGYQIQEMTQKEYQKMIENFQNHKDFPEICKLLVKHGNCKFEDYEIRYIWAQHVNGKTTRTIAKEVSRVKSRVDDVLRGLREWMKIA